MAKMTMTPAEKAARTTRARRALAAAYGVDTYDVLELAMKGKDSHTIEDLTGIPVPSVAAVLANLTRGCYTHVLRHCNF